MNENLKKFTAGGVGGMMAVFAGHPLGYNKFFNVSFVFFRK